MTRIDPSDFIKSLSTEGGERNDAPVEGAGECQPSPASTDTADPPPPADDAQAAHKPAASAPAEPTLSAGEPSEFILGPLTDYEKTQIIAGVRNLDLSAKEIAAALNRRTATVALFIAKCKELTDTSGPAASAQEPAEPAAQTQGPDSMTKTVMQEATVQVQDRDLVDLPPKAVAGAAGAPSSIMGDPRPLWWREIEAELNALGHKGDWTPARDLELVEALARGQVAEVTADQLGVEVKDLRERFIALTPRGYDARGRRLMSIDYQRQLLEVLRARVVS